MRILSVYWGHDSSVCLFEDGEVVAVEEKERVSRLKHAPGPVDLEVVLEKYSWRIDTVDVVVFNPYVRHEDGRHESMGFEITGTPFTEFTEYMSAGWRGSVEDRYSWHTVSILGRKIDAIAVDHHLGHVATAAYTSPADRSAVFSADGGGDWRTVALASVEGSQVVEIGYGVDKGDAEPNIGSVWSSVGVHHFGYGNHEAAGKLMGLAPHGIPQKGLVDRFRAMAHQHTFDPLPGVSPLLDSHSKTAADIAASLQEFTNGEFLSAAAEALRRYPLMDALSLTGGCAMNVVSNALLKRELGVSTWVPAQASDCGLALGQALFAWHHVYGHARTLRAPLPFYGSAEDEVGAVGEVVDALENGLVVGVCSGRSENGPRALGNRSMLADPRQAEIHEKINNQIKKREWYRPFAPMVLEEDYADHFARDGDSLYMSYVAEVQSALLPAITHVDGSTRPQSVPANGSSSRRILEAWKARTGIGVLLNTSFNSQEPLVDTRQDALATWRRSALDCVAVGDDFYGPTDKDDAPRSDG